MLIHTAKKTRLSLPNKTSLGIYTGYGGVAGFTRNSTETVIDFEGISRTAKVNEAAFKGARRVQNLILTDFNTHLITNATLTGGVLDPLGGSTAYTLTANAVNGDIRYTINSSGISNYIFSFWARRRTGTGAIIIYSDASPITLSGITSNWQRFSISDNNNLAIIYNIIRCSTQGDSIDIWRPQGENTSNQAVKAASDFVGFGGVKYFNYLNGNTVDANRIVTETKGAAISEATLKGVQIKTGAAQTIPTAQNINKYQGSLSFEFTPDANAAGTVALGGSYVDANNYTQILHIAGTGYIFRKRISGVNYDANLSGDFVADTTYTVKIKWSSYNGTDVFVNGVKGTNNPDTKPLQLGSTWQIGADGNGGQQAGACFKNVLTKYK